MMYGKLRRGLAFVMIVVLIVGVVGALIAPAREVSADGRVDGAWTAFGVGGEHRLVVLQNGSLWAWGLNERTERNQK